MKEFVLLIQDPDEKAKKLLKEIEPYSREKYKIHSSGGIEIVALIISICNLAVVIMGHPLVIDYLNRKLIRVKFQGFEVKDSVNKIMNEIAKNPDLLKKVRESYEAGTVIREGNINAIKDFDYKLKELLEK